MITLTRLDEVKQVKWALDELQPISRKLNAIDCRGCNGYHDECQEKRDITSKVRLIQRAQTLAKGIDLRFYHQSDPRGCSVYLIDETMDDSTYSRGIAI